MKENDLEVIKNSGKFDEEWYLSKNSDVKNSGFDALEHYYYHGEKEGRKPSESFSPECYLEKNLDVKNSGMSSLLHFIMFGENERREFCDLEKDVELDLEVDFEKVPHDDSGKTNSELDLESKLKIKNEKKYFLTMAANVRNEGKYLKEWINYHIYQGVEHFYINNDESTDDTLSILIPYIEKGIVTVYEGLRKNGVLQSEFYDQIINEKKNETEWCCFFDIDEFYQGNLPLRTFLYLLDYETIAVELFWKLFGDAHLENYEDDYVIKRFNMHCDKSLGATRHIKSICRLERTKKTSGCPHIFIYESGKIIHSNLKEVQDIPLELRVNTLEPVWENCWLNHYYCKTKEEYQEKIAKGSAATGREKKYAFDNHNKNDIEDNSMKIYVNYIEKINSFFE